MNYPINIGHPSEEHSMSEVANLIQRLLEELEIKRTEVIYTSARKDDPIRRRPDISKAEEVLDWRPTVSFEEGLRKTINYYRRNYF